MRYRSGRRARAIVLAVAGLLFAGYPAVRPYSDETSMDGARSIASAGWIVAHLCAMLSFVLLGLGLLALRDRIGLGAGRSPMAALCCWGWPDAVRYQPAAATLFGSGLLLLAAGAVLAAVAIGRARLRPPWAGVPLATGFVLFIPQFFGPPHPARRAHRDRRDPGGRRVVVGPALRSGAVGAAPRAVLKDGRGRPMGARRNMRSRAGMPGPTITRVEEPVRVERTDPSSHETYNPWTIVNLVFHHLAEHGLHPTFSDAGDPGAHAAAMLRALGIRPAAEGNRNEVEHTRDELARIRAAMFGEP